jgi:hypothetical protein
MSAKDRVMAPSAVTILVSVFAAGFCAGYGVRAFMSYRRRTKARLSFFDR